MAVKIKTTVIPVASSTGREIYIVREPDAIVISKIVGVYKNKEKAEKKQKEKPCRYIEVLKEEN